MPIRQYFKGKGNCKRGRNGDRTGLEKFFDRVNHDRLMSTLSKKVTDKRTLKLIRSYLTSGIMEGV